MSTKKNKNLISNDLTKEVNAVEKINKQEIKQKSEKILKERVIKIYFESLTTSDKRIHEFVYNDIYKNSNNKDIKLYILNLRKKLFNALNLRKIIKDFEITMALNDSNTDPQDKDKLPRAQKLKRLEQFYDTLVDMGLTLIHNFFWINHEEDKEGFITLEECIKLATPIIFYLKYQFEDSIHKEFILTNDELKVLKN